MPFRVQDFLADQIDASVTREIVYAGADETPKYAAINALGSAPANDVEHKWFHQGAQDYLTQIDNGGTAYDASTTTLVVDDSSVFKVGDIVNADASSERMRVSSIPNGTSIVVQRGIGGSTAAASSVANNAVLRAIGLAAGEGSGKPTARHAVPTRHTNYTQIFKRRIEMTGTAQALGLNTEDERARQRMFAMQELTREIERTINFGVKANNLTDADGNTVRAMGGLYQFITSNVFDPSGALTKDIIRSWARDVFATGSTTKLMFTGGVVLEQLEGLYEGQIRYQPGATAFGMRLGLLEVGGGQLQIVSDRSLNGAYERDALVVDPAQVRMRPIPGREMQLVQNVQDPGEDRVSDMWMGEFTLEYGAEPTHARLENVQDAA